MANEEKRSNKRQKLIDNYEAEKIAEASEESLRTHPHPSDKIEKMDLKIHLLVMISPQSILIYWKQDVIYLYMLNVKNS